ncbi:hypothetical protein ACFX13_003629 [Malus domestica]|uniref:non-specific serine/threonine protein kinase n=1 Tax=Malus domestica TaxID=3750 RepID=A0A498IZB6_MALDO|nr:hypothetical protein DVH24_034595 [Malus domestica]
MVKEFTESVLGIATEELVKKMIPVVLPKLVVSQQDDDQALETLYELAKCLNTDLVALIVNWLPKVLAFALHRADARGLVVALQFYHTQTGSDKQEISAAALPALLDELICFLDGGDSDEINRRLARVPEMIKEVARVLTGGEDLPSFLGNHFVGLLNSIDRKMLHAEDISLHKQALQRIEMLIKRMGSHLTTYVPKLMVLLMHAIDKEALQKRHDENPIHLDKAVKFLEELVLNNRVVLKQHIREFPPLPSISALTEVNKAIQEVQGSMTLKDRLSDVVDGLNHECLNVRYMVVCELSKLLSLKQEQVTSLITAEGVDPAKLKGFSCQRFKIECLDDDLIYELIHKHLARAFRAAPDTVMQDSAALAIQELLKIAGCAASLDENAASSTPSMSFRRWIFSWIRKLTSHATGSRSSIFNACREGARHGITEEIQCVLDVAASDNSGDAAHGVKGGKIEVCIQAVFTLLDNLGQWVDDTKQELALSQASQSLASKQQASKTKDQTRNSSADQEHLLVQCKYVSELLSAISKDQLLINKKAGNWAEAITSCEQALQMEPTSVQRHSDVLNSLLNMCHLQAMVTHMDGLISRVPQYKKTWCMQGVQAAWRLGRWDLMDEYLSGADEEGLLCSSSESNASFDMDVAKILQAMMKKDQFSVAEKIALSKQALIAPLAAAGMDSYVRAYPFVVKLHLLRELENFHSLLVDESFLEKSFQLGDHGFSQLMENWENRLRFTQPSLWAREPRLAFCRLVFAASALGAQVGNCWLQYAKLCRMAGHYETANQTILEAQATGGPNVHMEKVKLLWSTRRSDGAIAQLQQSLLNMPVEIVGSSAISSITSLSLVPLNQPLLVCDTQALNENRDIAKTLLYTRWIQHTRQKQKEDVLCLYTRVRELQPKWEKGYFYIAKYCEELLADARKRQEENIELGARKMPSNSAIVGSPNLSTEKPWWSYLPDVIKIMRGCLKDLPTYQWLTVLPQLVSRICHQNEEVVRLVKNIITTVLRQYPQQALWIMAAVSKSTVPSRREAAAEILQAAWKGFSQGNTGSNLFVPFANLIDHLIKLCFHPATDLPTISGIGDEAEILSSLQRPKKIILLGSDGIERPFLCKPKDDLRKDARMMEFTAMINCLLSKYPESRLRKLCIHTFAETVHVDFSCLFDKGLQLEKPELVPFRLTQNMIDGLGITGYEGIFLRVCEITLSVLRMHRETLMSVLETFVHDPLVEWTKSHKSSGVEVQNRHAQVSICCYLLLKLL